MFTALKCCTLLLVAMAVVVNSVNGEPPSAWTTYSTIQSDANNQPWQALPLPPREIATSQTFSVSTPYYQQYQQQSVPAPPAPVPYSHRAVGSQLVLAQPGLPAEQQIVAPSSQLLASENIFQARAPVNIAFGGQQSFFYSPKENAIYQVTKIQLAQAPALANGISAENPAVAPAPTAFTQPSQSYGPPTQYGPPTATTTTTPAPSSQAPRVVYKYRTRPKFNFTVELEDFNNDCYEEIQPEEVGENRHPKLTPQRIKHYRRRRGNDAARCNGPITDSLVGQNPLAPFPGGDNMVVALQPAAPVPPVSAVQGGDSYLPSPQAPSPPANNYGVPPSRYGAPPSSYGAPSTTYGPPKKIFFDEFEAAGPANSALNRRPGGSRVKLGISSEIGR